jgi:hypothetical protein
MRILYATLEEVYASPGVSYSARLNAWALRKLEAGTEAVEALTHRRFYPETKTITFDWPNYQYAPTWQLRVPDLISVTSLSAGGTSISPSNIFLRRDDDVDEAPYNIVEINLSSSAAWQSGSTSQRAISIAGVWGDKATDTAAVDGQLGGSINSSVTTVVINPVSNVLEVGTGALIRVGTEYMLTTARRMSDTGVNTAGTLDDTPDAQTLAVGDASGFAYGEVILVNAERMKIVDIAGNNLIVERAWDGSTLADHATGQDVYANRTYTVQRGVIGSTAASHTSSDSVTAHRFPGLVNELAIAETVVLMSGAQSAYSATTGAGAAQMEAPGGGLADLRNRCWAKHGRMGRLEAI